MPSLHGRPAGRPYDRRRDTIPPYALARVPEKPRRGERLTKDVGAHGVRPKPADAAGCLLRTPSRERKHEGECGFLNGPVSPFFPRKGVDCEEVDKLLVLQGQR